MDREQLKKLIEDVAVKAHNDTHIVEQITNDDLYWERTVDGCEFLCYDCYDAGISVYNDTVAFNEGTPWFETVKFDNTERITELTKELFGADE